MDKTSSDREAPLTLRVIRPDGKPLTVACDSVRLCIKDGVNGRDGGLLGIRHGHAPAVMALGDSPLWAFLQGQTVYEQRIHGGLAAVRNNVITVFPEGGES